MAQGDLGVSWVTKAYSLGARVPKDRVTHHEAHLFGSVFWIFNVYSSVSESEIDCWVEQLPFLFPNKAQVFLKKVYNSVIFS